jgi:site-specific DNA-cytosine methylase
MNVLSLFDGISCGQLALQRADIKVDNYFASEINPYSIAVTQHNFPNTIQLGDVRNIDLNKLPKIDLLIGGSPCQDISSLNSKSLGLAGAKSGLFYYFLNALHVLRPADYLLENVRGNKVAIESISKLLRALPITINSRLVTPQNRIRLYWTNVHIEHLPNPTKKTLKSILQKNVADEYYISGKRLSWLYKELPSNWNNTRKIDPEIANCLIKNYERSWAGNYITDKKGIRKITPIEAERLQTLPDNYTAIIPDRNRYEVLGDAWTVDIISFIMKQIYGCKD